MSSNEAQKRFIIEAIAAHNEYRKLHGVPALKVNAELNDLAQNWANSIASRKTLQHSTNKYKNDNLGENVAMWFSTGATYYDGNVYENLIF